MSPTISFIHIVHKETLKRSYLISHREYENWISVRESKNSWIDTTFCLAKRLWLHMPFWEDLFNFPRGCYLTKLILLFHSITFHKKAHVLEMLYFNDITIWNWIHCVYLLDVNWYLRVVCVCQAIKFVFIVLAQFLVAEDSTVTARQFWGGSPTTTSSYLPYSPLDNTHVLKSNTASIARLKFYKKTNYVLETYWIRFNVPSMAFVVFFKRVLLLPMMAYSVLNLNKIIKNHIWLTLELLNWRHFKVVFSTKRGQN